MIPPLTLIRTKQITAPISAGWLASAHAVDWLREVSHCRAAGCDVALYPVAASTSDPRAVGVLLIPRCGPVHFSQRVQPLTEVLPGVHAALDATLSAMLLENERSHFFPYAIHFFHPTYGLIGFDPRDELMPSRLLVRPRERGLRWNLAIPIEKFAPTLRSIVVEPPADPQQMLEEAAKEIGNQGGKLPDQDNTLLAKTTLIGKGLAGLLLLGAGGLIGGIAMIADRIGGTSPTGQGAQTPEAIEKLRRWAEQNWQQLADSRNREINRLLKLIETDPDQGLRYAIPLAGIEQSRGVAAPSWKLGQRQTNFSLGNGGEAIDGWNIQLEARLKLEHQYREAALREIALGRPERAAFIYGNLLADWSNAAKALADAGKHRDAVAIYLHKLNNRSAAAKCLEQAGLLLQAAALYAESKQFEKAGDLHAQLGNDSMARELWSAEMEAQHDPLEKARILSQKLHDDTSALALLDATWRSGKRPEAALHAMFAIHQKDHHTEHASALLSNMFAQEISNLPLSAKLKLAHNVTSDWQDPTLTLQLENLAFRHIGEALCEKSKSTAELLSFLPKLAPTDQILNRDAQRFSLQKNPPKILASGPPHGNLRPQRVVPIASNVRWDSLATLPKGVAIAGYGTEMLAVAQFRDHRCNSSALRIADDPGNTEVRHLVCSSQRGSSRLFHFPAHKRLHYRSLDRARSAEDDALGTLRNILAAGHYGSNGDFALLEFTATSSLALHIYSETAALMRSFPIDFVPPDVMNMDWRLVGAREHFCFTGSGFLAWRFPNGQFSNVNLGETPRSLHLSPNPKNFEALVTLSVEVLLVVVEKVGKQPETINLHSSHHMTPVACYLPDGSIVIAYDGGGMIYPAHDRINPSATLSLPTDAGKPVDVAACGNGGFAILTDKGNLLVFAQ